MSDARATLNSTALNGSPPLPSPFVLFPPEIRSQKKKEKTLTAPIESSMSPATAAAQDRVPR
jgi:hypothetical protein